MIPFDRTTLVLICDSSHDLKTPPDWLEEAGRQLPLRILAHPEANLSWEEGVFAVERWDAEAGPVACLNRVAARLDTDYLWLLYADETPRWDTLPGRAENGRCLAFAICRREGERPRRDYQIRFCPLPREGELFEGWAIPDPTRAFQREGWTLEKNRAEISKRSGAFPPSRIIDEAERTRETLLAPLWKGLAAAERHRYAEAEEYLRAVLDGRPLLEFDRLAACNNLAHAQLEQHKLDEAAETARRSTGINPAQRAPYLIMQRAHLMEGRREQSFEAMRSYLEQLPQPTAANMDTRLSASATHHLMADMKFREGDYEKAFHHYGEYYRLEEGEVEQPVLEKLFIYSIELKDRESSVRYFYDIFGEYLPDRLTDDMSARLLESLSLFMDNEWYDFVSEIYEQLVTQNPEDNELLNGWITTLIRNEEVEKARSLISVGKKTG